MLLETVGFDGSCLSGLSFSTALHATILAVAEKACSRVRLAHRLDAHLSNTQMCRDTGPLDGHYYLRAGCPAQPDMRAENGHERYFMHRLGIPLAMAAQRAETDAEKTCQW